MSVSCLLCNRLTKENDIYSACLQKPWPLSHCLGILGKICGNVGIHDGQ